MDFSMGSLQIGPAQDRIELLAPPVAAAIKQLAGAAEVGVAEIDPDLADTAEFCEHYGVGLQESANCVIVAGKRAGETSYAACLVLATTRADVNGLVRRHLGARKASFAPMDEAVSLTGMEYGGITPIGLPGEWPVLIDPAVAVSSRVIIGSGLRRSKLTAPGPVLTQLPNAVVLDGLGVPVL